MTDITRNKYINSSVLPTGVKVRKPILIGAAVLAFLGLVIVIISVVSNIQSKTAPQPAKKTFLASTNRQPLNTGLPQTYQNSRNHPQPSGVEEIPASALVDVPDQGTEGEIFDLSNSSPFGSDIPDFNNDNTPEPVFDQEYTEDVEPLEINPLEAARERARLSGIVYADSPIGNLDDILAPGDQTPGDQNFDFLQTQLAGSPSEQTGLPQAGLPQTGLPRGGPQGGLLQGGLLQGGLLQGGLPQGGQSLLGSRSQPSQKANAVDPMHIVQAGEYIPAILVGKANSDLPGHIVGRLTRPLMDSVTGTVVLAPQGTKIIGIVDANVLYGQDRLAIKWTHIKLPNTKSVDLGSMIATDPIGQSGIHDEVDRHYWRKAGGILLSSLVSISGSAASRSNDSNIVGDLGAGVAAGAAQVGSEFAREQFTIKDTLTIRAGYPLKILVHQDLVFPGPYEEYSY